MSTTNKLNAETLLEPPPGYLVWTTPNDGEYGTYTCPSYDGCDGIVCDNIEECYAHEKEWHSSPYSCAECSTSFAAYTALSRHIKASGHQQWVCHNAECELKGVTFDSHVSYYAHIINSSAHLQFIPPRENMNLELVEELSDNESDVDMTDGLSECPSLDGFICLEPCCSAYLRRFSTECVFQVHINSRGHDFAAKREESLLRQDLPAAELQAKQEAMREFRCDVKGCALFGCCLSTSQAYANHIQTTGHLFPRIDIDSGSDVEATEYEDDGPQPKLSCDVLGCPRHGHRFSNAANHQRHVQSVLHLRAAQKSTVNLCGETTLRRSPRFKQERLVIKTELDYDEVRAFRSSAPSPPFATPERRTFPTTPEKYATTPYTPLSSPFSTAREEYLERRNRQLEDELRRLHAEMDLLRSRT